MVLAALNRHQPMNQLAWYNVRFESKSTYYLKVSCAGWSMPRVNLNTVLAPIHLLPVVCIPKDRTLPISLDYMLCTLPILAD